MIKTYSQRMLPPFYGQVQIAESDRARALTIDCITWEIQFVHGAGSNQSTIGNQSKKRGFRRAAMISDHDIRQKKVGANLADDQEIDERILELTDFLADAPLPFPAVDHCECWLLDPEDASPLALLFSCEHAEEINTFPNRPEWTALPAAVMPIDKTHDEASLDLAPVNHRLERLVAERAGYQPQIQWYRRGEGEEQFFPPLMLREDWRDEESAALCQRYLQRQAPRLLMLHYMEDELRARLEQEAKVNALEVERYHPLYPEVIDKDLIDAIRVEARIRSASEDLPAVHNRRDGVHYM